MSPLEMRCVFVALAVSVCFLRGSAQSNAKVYVDRHSEACDVLDGKGVYEKYGQPPFQWIHYCNDDAANSSWLKCAGTGNDYLCLGANIGIKGIPDGVKALAVAATQQTPLKTSLIRRQSRVKHRRPVAVASGGDGILIMEGARQVSEAAGKVQGVSAVAVSGCVWAAGKGDIDLQELYGNKLKLAPDSDVGTCTARTSRPGHFLLMSMDGGWNPYESMHQPLMAFATIARLGLNPNEVRLVFASGEECPGCQMNDFVERVLSRGGPALHLNKESSLCLENVILPIPGEQSFILRNKGIDDPLAEKCPNSPVLAGFADYVKDSFAIDETLLGAGAKLRITLPLRKPSPEHLKPYNRQMNNSDELAGALQHSTAASTLFTFRADSAKSADVHADEEDAEAAMHAMMQQLASELQSTGEFDVREVVPPSMTMDEQVKLFSNTDLLIAPHGASLTWQILLPECGQVIEFCTGSDFHFVNIAHYAGKKHTCLPGPAGWGAKLFTADVSATLARVKEIKKEWQICQIREQIRGKFHR